MAHTGSDVVWKRYAAISLIGIILATACAVGTGYWVLTALPIGLLMVPAYLSSAASGRNYPLGVTHGVMQAELLLVDHNFQHIWTASPPPASSPAVDPAPTTPPGKKVSWWLVLLVSSLVLGSWVSGRMSGQAKLLPKPPDEVSWHSLGGFSSAPPSPPGVWSATLCPAGH